jgi:aerobic-type carbon monoxide dehydrogenase small subunit (CoxS/CutS family)
MAGPIHAQVNGKSRAFESDPDTTLLFALREELGLTGTKYGCGEGQCGACTILLNGTPRRSCQLSVSDAAGKSIVTVEGFEQNGQLHPVQQAFLDQGAFQCAYCTSGMIVSSVALLQKNPNPSEPEIVQALQGNICRCGTHPRIIAAVQQAAKAVSKTAPIAMNGASL